MIDERLTQMINAAADGELSADDQIELDQQLADSVEARAYHAQLEQMEAALRSIEQIEPPAVLRQQILRRIKLPHASASASASASDSDPASRPGFVSGLLAEFGRVPALMRYGVTAAAGLLLAVAFYETTSGSIGGAGADFHQMAGTMVSREVSDALILDSYRSETDRLTSSARLEQHDDSLILDLEFDSEMPVDVRIKLADTGLRIASFVQIPIEAGFETLEFADQTMHLKGRGRRRAAVLLHSSDTANPNRGETHVGAITLEFSSNGNVVQQAALRPYNEE